MTIANARTTIMTSLRMDGSSRVPIFCIFCTYPQFKGISEKLSSQFPSRNHHYEYCLYVRRVHQFLLSLIQISFLNQVASWDDLRQTKFQKNITRMRTSHHVLTPTPSSISSTLISDESWSFSVDKIMSPETLLCLISIPPPPNS